MMKLRAIQADQHGNESMQTVMIMAVGALILLALSSLFKHISPTVTKHVQAVLSGDAISTSSGGAFTMGSGSTNGPSPIAQSNSGQSSSSQTSGESSSLAGVSSSPTQPQTQPIEESDLLESLGEELPKFLADSANDVRDAIAKELGNHLSETLPELSESIGAIVDDLVQQKGKLDPLSDAARELEEKISGLRQLQHKDLENLALGIEGRLAFDKQLTPILKSLGRMFALDKMIHQDGINQSIGNNPNATPEQAYQAYLETFKVSSGMLADGVIDYATRGGAKPGRTSEALNNPGVQVAIGMAADRAGQAVAEQLFPAFNSFSHWLYDNGYSPRHPRFPRDWQPPKN